MWFVNVGQHDTEEPRLEVSTYCCRLPDKQQHGRERAHNRWWQVVSRMRACEGVAAWRRDASKAQHTAVPTTNKTWTPPSAEGRVGRSARPFAPGQSPSCSMRQNPEDPVGTLSHYTNTNTASVCHERALHAPPQTPPPTRRATLFPKIRHPGSEVPESRAPPRVGGFSPREMLSRKSANVSPQGLCHRHPQNRATKCLTA